MASSGKANRDLGGQDLVDSVQLEGTDRLAGGASGGHFSKKSLKPGECGSGICNNASIKASDFVFAVATHKLNEPTLIAGRAGRLVRPYDALPFCPQ